MILKETVMFFRFTDALIQPPLLGQSNNFRLSENDISDDDDASSGRTAQLKRTRNFVRHADIEFHLFLRPS